MEGGTGWGLNVCPLQAQQRAPMPASATHELPGYGQVMSLPQASVPCLQNGEYDPSSFVPL